MALAIRRLKCFGFQLIFQSWLNSMFVKAKYFVYIEYLIRFVLCNGSHTMPYQTMAFDLNSQTSFLTTCMCLVSIISSHYIYSKWNEYGNQSMFQWLDDIYRNHHILLIDFIFAVKHLIGYNYICTQHTYECSMYGIWNDVVKYEEHQFPPTAILNLPSL